MEGEEVVEVVVEGNRSAGRMVRVREVLRGLNFSKLPVFTCVCSVFIIPLFDRCLTCCEETKAPAAERREERGKNLQSGCFSSVGQRSQLTLVLLSVCLTI